MKKNLLQTLSSFLLVAIATLMICTQPVAAQETDQSRTVLLNPDQKVVVSKSEIAKGKKLFNSACASCHVGGATFTNPNVGLDLPTLALATPRRDTIEGLVDYMKNPTTFDGEEDISELHPSLKSTDIFPIMRGLTDPELKAIASYMLYSANLKGVSWGGGKIYY